jgi:hypothetical protein
MITNNVDFLQRVILSMAKEKYDEEFIDSNVEIQKIGKDGVWRTKRQCIEEFLFKHFNKAKMSLVENYKKDSNSVTDEILTPENTIAMRMYSLEVGESFEFDNFNRIIRFPGGWGYKSQLNESMMFIPFSAEFCVEHGILANEFKKLNDDHGELIDEKRSEATV